MSYFAHCIGCDRDTGNYAHRVIDCPQHQIERLTAERDALLEACKGALLIVDMIERNTSTIVNALRATGNTALWPGTMFRFKAERIAAAIALCEKE